MLLGHFEGADRLDTFSRYNAGVDPLGDIRLRATASGPWTVNASTSSLTVSGRIPTGR
jgi:hypothetical protein